MAISKRAFGILDDGTQVSCWTLTNENGLQAEILDYGATLRSIIVPDKDGKPVDVLLGYDTLAEYAHDDCYLGATVGRVANRIKGASFTLNGETIQLPANERANNLHSGPDFFHQRMWKVDFHNQEAITLHLESPDGDQGFPGKANITVTYSLDHRGALHIEYEAISDKDTVFNLTNHSYFNLAGHEKLNAMDQVLSLSGRYFNPDDAENIPTGEIREVEGTPMDFRKPKPIGQDINADYEPLHLQGGYDHNWEVYSNPCATLTDPVSGRGMCIFTDCPGIQFYAGNFISEHTGKGGVTYGKRSGVALETQYFPDSLNHPEWDRPITKAGETYHSETIYWFY